MSLILLAAGGRVTGPKLPLSRGVYMVLPVADSGLSILNSHVSYCQTEQRMATGFTTGFWISGRDRGPFFFA
jgi:hypothetical protein